VSHLYPRCGVTDPRVITTVARIPISNSLSDSADNLVPDLGCNPLRYIPLTCFCFLVPLTVLAGDPPLGYPADSADRPERDPHTAVQEVLFLGDGGGDLGLEFHQAPEPAQGVA